MYTLEVSVRRDKLTDFLGFEEEGPVTDVFRVDQSGRKLVRAIEWFEGREAYEVESNREYFKFENQVLRHIRVNSKTGSIAYFTILEEYNQELARRQSLPL